MARPRFAFELSTEDLRQMIIDRRRAERQARLNHFRRTGKIHYQPAMAVKSGTIEKPGSVVVPIAEDLEKFPYPHQKRKTWLDHALLFIEITAVVGLVVILFNGVTMLSNLNQQVASALVQPTFTPTALIMAVVLPSGHMPPNSPGGVRPNEAEIPDHLRPLVQSIANLPVPTPGPQQAMRLQIPAINIDYPIVQGDGWEQLKKGVGQHIGTPNPGEKGNIVLSAHNDIFGEIFRDLDKLQPGDPITLFTSQRSYTYIVSQTQIVEPTQIEVMAPSQDAIVTLISCYPYMVDDKRIAVTAYLQK